MKKQNKLGLVIGVAAAGAIAYLLLRKPTTNTVTIPTAPAAGSSTASSTTGLLAAALNAAKSLFGGSSSSPSFTPVSTAPVTSTTAPSPAGGVTYINPSSAPTLQIQAPAYQTSDTAANDFYNGDSDIFL